MDLERKHVKAKEWMKVLSHPIRFRNLADRFQSASVKQHVVSVESSSLLLHSIKRDLFIYRDDSLTT